MEFIPCLFTCKMPKSMIARKKLCPIDLDSATGLAEASCSLVLASPTVSKTYTAHSNSCFWRVMRNISDRTIFTLDWIDNIQRLFNGNTLCKAADRRQLDSQFLGRLLRGKGSMLKTLCYTDFIVSVCMNLLSKLNSPKEENKELC